MKQDPRAEAVLKLLPAFPGIAGNVLREFLKGRPNYSTDRTRMLEDLQHHAIARMLDPADKDCWRPGHTSGYWRQKAADNMRDYLRKEHRRRPIALRASREDERPEAALERLQDKRKHQAPPDLLGWLDVGELTPREQEIVRLRVAGHSLAEIGERLDLSAEGVRKILLGIRKQLKSWQSQTADKYGK
jgi:RNA polymerase sigma factor (sigma-70 family)